MAVEFCSFILCNQRTIKCSYPYLVHGLESSISILLAWALIINKEPFQEDLNLSPFLMGLFLWLNPSFIWKDLILSNRKKIIYIIAEITIFRMLSILQARKPFPVFLPEKFHGNFQEIAFKGQRMSYFLPGGPQSTGLQREGHDWATEYMSPFLLHSFYLTVWLSRTKATFLFVLHRCMQPCFGLTNVNSSGSSTFRKYYLKARGCLSALFLSERLEGIPYHWNGSNRTR